MADHTKVKFVQKTGEGEFVVEGLWCLQAGEYFQVDNIPFIVKRVSLGDVIKAEFDQDEQALFFDDFVSVSGNSTVRLYFKKEVQVETVRRELEAFGCQVEIMLQMRILAVNVPSSISYHSVKEYLDRGEATDRWVYEESCLAHDVS